MEKAAGKILIVEDSHTQAETIRLNLEAAGYEVTVASDGAEALKEFIAGNYDLVLSDILMPNLGGYELCREIKRLSPQTPVLLLTQLKDLSDLIEGLRAGADSYLLKPWEREHLLTRIEHAINSRGKISEVRCDTHDGFCQLDKTFVNNLDRRKILEYLVTTFDEFLHVRQQQQDMSAQATRRKEEEVEEKEELFHSLVERLKDPLLSGDAQLQELLSGSHGPISREQQTLLEQVKDSHQKLIEYVERLAAENLENQKMSKRPVPSIIRRS